MNPHTGSRKQLILIVDDQDLILTMLEKMLEFLGYRAIGVKSGEAALAVFQSHLAQGQPFDAVIVDWLVPGGMNGKQIFAALRRMDPTIKGVLSSGFLQKDLMAEEIDPEYRDLSIFSKLLSKPYNLKTLTATLESLFGEDPLVGGRSS
jgi:CheY-like chemotaxis protein